MHCNTFCLSALGGIVAWALRSRTLAFWATGLLFKMHAHLHPFNTSKDSLQLPFGGGNSALLTAEHAGSCGRLGKCLACRWCLFLLWCLSSLEVLVSRVERDQHLISMLLSSRHPYWLLRPLQIPAYRVYVTARARVRGVSHDVSSIIAMHRTLQLATNTRLSHVDEITTIDLSCSACFMAMYDRFGPAVECL